MSTNIKKLIEEKLEDKKLVAREVIDAFLKYLSDSQIEEAISNGDLDISENELMDYKRDTSEESLILVKDFEEYRIEVRKNDNGYFPVIMEYDEANVPDNEVWNAADEYSYFNNSTDAWEYGKQYIVNLD